MDVLISKFFTNQKDGFFARKVSEDSTILFWGKNAEGEKQMVSQFCSFLKEKTGLEFEVKNSNFGRVIHFSSNCFFTTIEDLLKEFFGLKKVERLKFPVHIWE